MLAELIADLLPPGVLNIVNGFGREAGMPLASSKRIAKIAFTGSTATGRVIAQAAADNLIPATLELGGKSPNIFFDDIADADDDFFDKAIEGLVLFAFNQGEVCTCPSRALIQESIYDRFMARALERVKAIKQGNPLDTDTMMGAQASADADGQDHVATSRSASRKAPKLLIGGERAQLGGDLASGYYIQPTLFKGNNKMRIFQEEIFGPVLAVTTFKDEAEALADRQRHAVRPGRRRLDARRQHAPTAWAAPSRPAACGPTATTPTRRTPPSAATRSRASAARPTR